MKRELLKELPKVDELLSHPTIIKEAATCHRRILLKAIRHIIDATRQSILNGTFKGDHLDIDDMMMRILKKAKSEDCMQLKSVVNATGVVLHTNLGRAPLSEYTLKAISSIATEYNTLEYNISTGDRGSRYSHVETIINELTGAEASLVVNNNAAAVMLILSAMAKDLDVIVSRGELVEIGGSFRVPEIMKQSGAKLIEVGTTNKTHAYDYEQAIDIERTGLILKVHTSNYRIVGFTEEVSLETLADIGKTNNIPVVYDLGCGLLHDFSDPQLRLEKTVFESLKSGIDIVSFSGDKLLGGPQAGIIVGKKSYIDKMKQHPLTRAFRIDKLTLAALEATLRLYLDEDEAKTHIPVLRMLSMSRETLYDLALTLSERFVKALPSCLVTLESGKSQVGGGAMPTVELETTLIRINTKNIGVHILEKKLRQLDKPIIVRLFNDSMYLDVRTIATSDFDYIVDAFSTILNEA